MGCGGRSGLGEVQPAADADGFVDDDAETYDSFGPDAPRSDAFADGRDAIVDVVDGKDTLDAADGATCPSTSHACGETCVRNDDVKSCGTSCVPCPAAPTHGAPTCASGACAFDCDDGYALVGGACVLGAPRPLSPLSTATVTSRSPTLRWRLPPGTDGARVQLCADRACVAVTDTFDVLGSSTKLKADLAAGVHFWRLFTRIGGTTLTRSSPTWEFFVGQRSAARDVSFGTTLDVNGDGLADVAIASKNLMETFGSSIGRIYVYQGSLVGLPSTPTTVIRGIKPAEWFGRTVASAGDVNGDGYADLLAGAEGGDRVYLFLGGPDGVPTTPSATIVSPSKTEGDFGFSIASAGDVNQDGYGDIVVGAYIGRAYVFHGDPHGLGASPATVLEAPLHDSRFGIAVSGGDFDGDGFGDVAVAADFSPPG